jgi:hypothetical protein
MGAGVGGRVLRGAVDAAFYAGATMLVSLVPEGVGQGLCRIAVRDGVARSVELGMEVPKREGTGGLAEEDQAEGPQLSTDDEGGLGRSGRKWFVRDRAASPAAPGVVNRSNLVVYVFDLLEELLAAGGEVEELLVERADGLAELVLLTEEALQAGVGDCLRLATQRDEVAAVDIRQARDLGAVERIDGVGLGRHSAETSRVT